MHDTLFMRRALNLAVRARGRTSPNPMVGAVLVKGGRIVAEDYHRRPGTPHAEALVLQKAGRRARASTLYVSLEPCCHTDKRTPPCAVAIIASRVRRVVVAMADPNPKVSGKGIRQLRDAGIEVVTGVLDETARKINECYCKHVTIMRPFVILKVAMTLDGKIAAPSGKSKWIAGEKARNIGLPASYSGKTLLGVCAGNPNVMYASVGNAFNQEGFYRTDNGGNNWTKVSTQDVCTYQGWYSHDVTVHPTNPDIFLWGGIDAWKSTNGGTSVQKKSHWFNWYFGQVPVGGPEGPGNYVHADIHRVYWQENDPNKVYLVTDGGIFVSYDGGINWEGRNGGYQTQQFYANCNLPHQARRTSPHRECVVHLPDVHVRSSA